MLYQSNPQPSRSGAAFRVIFDGKTRKGHINVGVNLLDVILPNDIVLQYGSRPIRSLCYLRPFRR
jgi:hypothetical protein